MHIINCDILLSNNYYNIKSFTIVITYNKVLVNTTYRIAVLIGSWYK